MSRAILFGSCARGTPHPESDIDLLILSPDFEDLKWSQERLAWEVAKSIDWRLEPVLRRESTYDQNDWHPFIDVAKREGIEVEARVF